MDTVEANAPLTATLEAWKWQIIVEAMNCLPKESPLTFQMVRRPVLESLIPQLQPAAPAGVRLATQRDDAA